MKVKQHLITLRIRFNMYVLSLVLLLFSPFSHACVALVYHHFDTTTPPSTSIDPALFKEHLKYLEENAFTVLTVSELFDVLTTKTSLPNKCVVLTTDDAYTSIYTYAYPLLKKYNMPMSVFVATDMIDKKYGAYLTYEQMKSMQDIVSFYNHSKDHSYLHTLSAQEVKDNITHAERRLEEELGVTEKILAFPYGEYSHETLKSIKQLGYVGFAQHSGAINSESNIYALPRFPMTNVYGNMKSFATKVNTLALPHKSASNTYIVTTNPPTLSLTLKKPLALNCFANGKAIKNIQKNGLRYTITADEPLPLGRNKYNCTARSEQKGRFYWYSHQWIVQ